MKNLNKYIAEKLIINKNFNHESDKDYVVNLINKICNSPEIENSEKVNANYRFYFNGIFKSTLEILESDEIISIDSSEQDAILRLIKNNYRYRKLEEIFSNDRDGIYVTDIKMIKSDEFYKNVYNLIKELINNEQNEPPLFSKYIRVADIIINIYKFDKYAITVSFNADYTMDVYAIIIMEHNWDEDLDKIFK